MAASLEPGNAFSEMSVPIIGMAIAGSTRGAFIGAITGLAMIRFQRRPAQDE